MKYKHRWISGDEIDLPLGKIVCAGRNYAAHIAELNNSVPSEPVLFIKPATALVSMSEALEIPKNRGEVHYETELAVLIKDPMKNITESKVESSIIGVGLGLDLTLRDVQNRQKQKGLPWEVAKAFDGSCPLSGFVAMHHIKSLDRQAFSLSINGQLKQQGVTEKMLTPVLRLISFISQHFTLMPGDVILTGTPEGVGALHSGDELTLELGKLFSINTRCT